MNADWGLDDPSGKSDQEYKRVINKIHENISNLARRIKSNKI